MPTLEMFMGLPASGKTTIAKARVLKYPNSYKRVNKDDLREMLDGGHWSKGNEKFVLLVRDQIIREALNSGRHVICDDTNLHPKHEQQLRQIAKECDARFHINKVFLDVPVEECIKRDLKRQRSVGSDVIMGMYNQFLRPPAPVYEPPEDKPQTIIIDIDGTLAHHINSSCPVHGNNNNDQKCTCRSPFDWNRVGEDLVDEAVANIIETFSSCETHTIILLSGRDGSCRKETIAWLEDHGIYYDHLFMREANDMRKDTVVKRELFEEHILDHYNVRFVIDDRNQVVDMWRDEIGLKVLHVGDYRTSNF